MTMAVSIKWLLVIMGIYIFLATIFVAIFMILIDIAEDLYDKFCRKHNLNKNEKLFTDYYSNKSDE